MYPSAPYVEQFGEFQARSSPGLSLANTARFYFDGTNVMLSVAGGAYAAIGGGGGGGTLDAAYDFGGAGAGRTITVDAGAVALVNAQTTGTVLAITSPGVTATGPITGLSVDLSGVTGGLANLATGIEVIGNLSTAAKSRKSGLLSLQSRFRNASALWVSVRNKQALAGSLVGVGWDDVNYEGATAASVLAGQTHMLTLDGQTNVNAATNNVEFGGLRVLVPSTTNVATVPVAVRSLQRAGTYLSLQGSGAILSTSAITGIEFSPGVGGTLTLGSSLRGFLVDLNSGVTAGASQLAGGDIFVGGSSASGSYCLNLANYATGANPYGIYLVMAPGSATDAVGISIRNNTVSSGSCAMKTEWESRSGCTNGIVRISLDVTSPTTAPTTFLKIDSIASWGGETGALTGINVDFGTSVSPSSTNPLVCFTANLGNQNNHPGDRVMYLSSNQTNGSSSALEVWLEPIGAGTANAISSYVGANVAASLGTGRNLNCRVRTHTGGGIYVATETFTGAFSGSATFFTGLRSGTWSAGGSENARLVNVQRNFTISATGTLSGAAVYVRNVFDVTAGTTTYSANDVEIVRDPSRSGGTLNISGSMLTLTHAPSGTIGTDTTSLITGTTISKSGTVVGITATSVLTGDLTMLAITSSGVTAGAQAVRGISIAIPQSTSGSSKGITITTNASGIGAAGFEIFMSPTTASSTVLGIDMTMSANVGSGGFGMRQAIAGAAQGVVVNHAAAATGAALYNLNFFNETGTVSGTRNGRTFLVGRDNAFNNTGAYAIGEACIYYAPSVSNGTYTGNQYALLIQSMPSRSGGTMNLSDVLLDISHAPTGTINTDATTGLRITMSPSGSKPVAGASIVMSASATGAALSIAHSGATAHQVAFTVATDGAAFHLYGPTTGQFRIGAGIPTGTANGREVAIVASDASTTGAGGSIYLNEGAGAGGGARGTIAIGTAATMTLALFGGAGATQQTPTGSRGGNAALASLLTALAAYGFIVDGTSA